MKLSSCASPPPAGPGRSARGQELWGRGKSAQAHCTAAQQVVLSRHPLSQRPAYTPSTAQHTHVVTCARVPLLELSTHHPGTRRGPATRPRPGSHAATPARGSHTLAPRGNKGEHRVQSRRGRAGAAPLLASRSRKLSQRDHHECQHHAGGQQGGDHDGCNGPWSKRSCGGQRSMLLPSPTPRSRPGLGLHAVLPPSPPSHPPGVLLASPGPTSILVRPCGRGAVHWSWSRGGERRARNCKFLAVAGAFQGTFTRGQINGLIPQGGIGPSGTLCCKAKDRQWGSGSLWAGMTTLPTSSPEECPVQNSSSALHPPPHSSR